MVVRRLSLPVPKGFFVCPPLDATEAHALVQRAQSGFADLVDVCQLDTAAVRWRLDSDLDGLHLYFGSHRATATILGVTTIQATIEEAPAMLRFDTHDHFADFCSMYYTDVVDCASLYTLCTSPAEYIGVKWEALQSPVQGIMKPRDCTVVECSKAFTYRNGVRGYGRSIESVDVACVPDLNATFGLVRMHIGRGGLVLRETKRPGIVQAMYLLQADLKGAVPQWMIRLVLRGRARALGHLDAYFRHRRVITVPALSPFEMVPATKRNRCAVCQEILPDRGAARFRCSVCGEMACSTCQSVWHVEDRKASVCNLCAVEPSAGIAARVRRVSVDSKSGTSLSTTVVVEEDPGYVCSDDQYAVLDTFVLESVRSGSSSRRQSVPLRPKTKPTLRPSSSSAPHPLVHLYTPPSPPPLNRRDRRGTTVLPSDVKVDTLLQQLKDLDFDDAMLAPYQATRHGDA
ncbi:hypothetical protein H310_01781 [Aphanomyces invadans]|uniref:START domain-containing protein n=1 Tax=Aphanomyces invadans TaxID=157072 RepID=A0A024UMR0_9STRA|nr:hypothetical protein H310_01781 [Aphanomyces invadans]ETW07152.1 hypothetical protein H310_01781 [Aphanomyces invadans]|eukprot:XP_008863245.1 hypothetical protein H310_01781 [Aphanomyces invadans]